MDGILEKGIPEELLMASLNSTEFASLERPGSIPDGVLDAINASAGWLHTGDPALLLHTNALFASLREKLEQGWFNELLRELFAPAPVEIIQVPTLPKKEEEGRAARTDGKLVLDHPLTAADLGEGKSRRRAARSCWRVQNCCTTPRQAIPTCTFTMIWAAWHRKTCPACICSRMSWMSWIPKAHGPGTEHSAEHLVGKQWCVDGLLDGTAGRPALPRKAHRGDEYAGTQPRKGCGAGQ